MGSGISVLEGDRWDSWKYAVRRKFSHFPAAHFIRFLAFSLRFTYYSLLRILGGASNAERLASQTGAWRKGIPRNFATWRRFCLLQTTGGWQTSREISIGDSQCFLLEMALTEMILYWNKVKPEEMRKLKRLVFRMSFVSSLIYRCFQKQFLKIKSKRSLSKLTVIEIRSDSSYIAH